MLRFNILLLAGLLLLGCSDDSSNGSSPTGEDAGSVDMRGSDASDQGLSDMASVPDSGNDANNPDMAADPCDEQAAGWVELGGPLNALTAPSSAATPHVIIDDECRPVVAWRELNDEFASQIVAMRWDGNDWNPLGMPFDGDRDPDTIALSPVLASSGDRLFAVWVENSDGFRFFAAEYLEGSWSELEGLSAYETLAPLVDAGIDSSGRLVVGLSSDGDGELGADIGVFRREGDTWNQLGDWLNASTTPSAAGGPSLSFTDSGEPLIGWQQESASHVRAWDGSQWASFGPRTLTQTGNSRPTFQVRLARSAGSDVFAGWLQQTGTATEIFVRRWDGSDWVVVADELDADSNASGPTDPMGPALIADSLNRPTIAWAEATTPGGTPSVYIRRDEGNGFVPLGDGVFDVLPGDTDSDSPSLAVDSRDRVVLAFREATTDGGTIYVWRYRD